MIVLSEHSSNSRDEAVSVSNRGLFVPFVKQSWMPCKSFPCFRLIYVTLILRVPISNDLRSSSVGQQNFSPVELSPTNLKYSSLGLYGIVGLPGGLDTTEDDKLGGEGTFRG